VNHEKDKPYRVSAAISYAVLNASSRRRSGSECNSLLVFTKLFRRDIVRLLRQKKKRRLDKNCLVHINDTARTKLVLSLPQVIEG
jgi:hypothetical protein